MGGLFSKSSRTQKSKDPKWQGIGPNTPLPGAASSSPSSPNSNNYSHASGSNGGAYGYQQQSPQPRPQTLSTLDSRPSANNTSSLAEAKRKQQKASKIMLLLKLDPKAGGQRKVITKNLISLPSDFRHTGHIGAGEVRSGQIDPEKIKNQMAEVAACLKLDVNTPIPILKTIPIQPENQDPAANHAPEQVDRYAARPGAAVF
ncbi:hypothetical protein BG015_002038 [Linnemannia schmuckeri]|uniref:CRIB domain-containing protein n=1 Tax=Linnemannia schmuckeri TaxID=64567 RepID=A0A9P5S5M5_9FUNG|nr:hypothetical protein BG015_002038 [Linnemannia schmuckeri]